MRWLALDVGSRRVGLAICDEEERVVTPLPFVPFGSAHALGERVAGLVAERGVGGVVVGVPRTLAGESRGERRVAGVLEALKARLDIPVEEADERGTTAEAQALLREAGVPARRWPDLIDSTAARVILESFLTQRGRSRRSCDTSVDRNDHGC